MSSLVELFAESKKAFAQGQALCIRADEIQKSTPSLVIEALALDAEGRFLTETVLDQLSLAGAVAKSVAVQRTRLHEDARGWDSARAERNQSLDAILENLALQKVPPNLHSITSGSSLFGSQHSLQDVLNAATAEADADVGSAARRTSTNEEREKWKTLRDFVDEKAIEDALERMEEERTALDDILAQSASHPSQLTHQLSALKSSLPPSSSQSPSESMNALLSEQDSAATEMASRLESLTAHYDQTCRALQDEEAGEGLHEGEMLVLERDTGLLPGILSELEASVHTIESAFHEVASFRDTARSSLDTFGPILLQLENLEASMGAMLEENERLQAEAAHVHASLETQYRALQELEETYHSYALAYDHLIIEMDRRARYREMIQGVVERMGRELAGLRNEELEARENFIASHGVFLPDDLCPYVPENPVLYGIVEEGMDGDVLLDEGIVAEARRNLGLDQSGSIG